VRVSVLSIRIILLMDSCCSRSFPQAEPMSRSPRCTFTSSPETQALYAESPSQRPKYPLPLSNHTSRMMISPPATASDTEELSWLSYFLASDFCGQPLPSLVESRYQSQPQHSQAQYHSRGRGLRLVLNLTLVHASIFAAIPPSVFIRSTPNPS
jgi:hypothetical protein